MKLALGASRLICSTLWSSQSWRCACEGVGHNESVADSRSVNDNSHDGQWKIVLLMVGVVLRDQVCLGRSLSICCKDSARTASYLRHAVAKIVKGERKTKHNSKFFCFPKPHPIFATSGKEGGRRAPRPFLSMMRSCLVLDKPKVLTRKKTSKAEKKCEKKRKILSIHKKCLNLHQN